MRRFTAIILTAGLVAGLLAGCGGSTGSTENAGENSVSREDSVIVAESIYTRILTCVYPAAASVSFVTIGFTNI